MKTQEIEILKNEIENKIFNYQKTLLKIDEVNKKISLEINKIRDQLFKEEKNSFKNGYGIYLEKYAEKEELILLEKYYDSVFKKVFKKLSLELIELFFKTCKKNRDISDFQNLLAFDEKTRSYPYIINLNLSKNNHSIICDYFNKNKMIYRSLRFEYHCTSDVITDFWNTSKSKYETFIYFENFEKHINSDCFINYQKNNNITEEKINFDIEAVKKEFIKIKELKKDHKIQLEELQQKQVEELKQKDILNLSSLLN